MNYEHIKTDLSEGILTVTLDRQEHLNALTLSMRADLLDCVHCAEKNTEVKALLFTGQGNKAFSAGTHIPELRDRTMQSELSSAASLRKELPTAIERLSKPSVAAINGYCLGGGLELTLGCTIRIASDNALVGLPEITLGQIPGSGGTQRLYRFVGLGWAMQMILTGEKIDAQTACSIGLVTEVHSLEKLLPRARELAKTLGSRAPLAFASGRDAVLRSTETDLLNGIDYERKLYAICMATDDNHEGLDAYEENRAPNYRGG